MGPTNPVQAGKGTIRGDFGTDIERNVVHGSDSKDSVVFEITYFFKGTEIY
jgi:nucleoside-diphosphate kinase